MSLQTSGRDRGRPAPPLLVLCFSLQSRNHCCSGSVIEASTIQMVALAGAAAAVAGEVFSFRLAAVPRAASATVCGIDALKRLLKVDACHFQVTYLLKEINDGEKRREENSRNEKIPRQRIRMQDFSIGKFDAM